MTVSRLAGSRGWCPGTSGNSSVLNPEERLVYIKGTGKSMAEMDEADILTVDLDGKVIQGEGRPSKEVNFHVGLYKTRPDVQAVLHTHPPYATALGTAGRPFPAVLATARAAVEKAPLVPYLPPGSMELAEAVLEAFRDPEVKAAILRAHGVVAIGKTIREAYHMTEWLEDAVKVTFLSTLMRRYM
ncbi:MAG: class II aldolase/adducin family protein [Candidatus Bathyarchaeia archaeon]